MMGISVTMPTVQTALNNILQEAIKIDHQMFGINRCWNIAIIKPACFMIMFEI